MSPLPTVEFPCLWHVGTLDPSQKRRGSYEGAGLSLSRHPGAWRLIARGLVSGPCWRTEAKGRRLLDAHALDEEHRAAILGWARTEGLCLARTMWRHARWDDEIETEIVQIHASLEDAREEADWNGEPDEEIGISEIHEHLGTSKLMEAVMTDNALMGDHAVIEAVLPLWIQTLPDIDGVWWEDRLDVLAYSAPRGCIPADKIAQWEFTPTDFEPEDESDLIDEVRD